MKIKLLLIFTIILSHSLFCQPLRIDKIDPPNWWRGMKLNNIQLMVYGKNLNDITASFNDPSLSVKKVNEIKNSSYAFIDIEIDEMVKAGNYKLLINNGKDTASIYFPIFERRLNSNGHKGFNSQDVIYLITPDRFANGDTSNDIVPEMIDEFFPDDPYGRHGGDIQGIINKLDYLKNLGVTALWVNPLVENNTKMSYHGYAATNLYKIDSRFGANELYKKLVEETHKRGLKIIFDHVSNHISIDHPWVKNLPMDDWLNGSVNEHELTHHYKLSYLDVHADSISIENYIEGWFTDQMADLNQENVFVKNYLIQNMIWWIEYSGLDGIREDTYPYSNQKYLSDWAKIILNEYPNLNIVGEVWVNDPVFISFYQRGSFYPKKFDSNLPAVTDFGTWKVYEDFLTGKGNLHDIYANFAKDFLYSDTENLVTFLENHDIQRAIFAAEGNVDKFKIAFTLLLTTRGIPEILYGTEIGITGDKDDGRIRSNFPGGFPDDKRDAFSENGRTEREDLIFDFVKKMLHLRRQYKALSSGKFIQLPPKDGIYIYFKLLNDEKFMIAINSNPEKRSVDLNKIEALLKNSKELENILTNEKINLNYTNKIEMREMSAGIFMIE